MGQEAGETVYRDQRTCMAMVRVASRMRVTKTRWVAGPTGRVPSLDGVPAERSLEKNCPCREGRSRCAPASLGFGNEYDLGANLKDLPHEGLSTPIQKGIPWKDRDNPNARSRRGRWTLWRGYAVSVIRKNRSSSVNFATARPPWKWHRAEKRTARYNDTSTIAKKSKSRTRSGFSTTVVWSGPLEACRRG